MKKITKFLVVASMALVGFLAVNVGKGEAANIGSWHAVKNMPNCEIRMVTDAFSYSTKATTIDVYMEKRGTGCKSTNYTYGVTTNGVQSRNHQGYFTYTSPVKKIVIDSIPGIKSGSQSVSIQGLLYTTSYLAPYQSVSMAVVVAR